MPHVRVRFKATERVLHRIVLDNVKVPVPAGEAGVTFELDPGRHFIAWFVRGPHEDVKYSILINSGKVVLAYRANVPLGQDRKSFDSTEFRLQPDEEASLGDIAAFDFENAQVLSFSAIASGDIDESDESDESDEDVSFIPPEALPR